MKKTNSQSGWVLLSFILVATVLVTIGLAVLNTSRQQTVSTKQQEDQVKALAAAEAGIDAVIKLTPGAEITIESLNLDDSISGTAYIDTTLPTSFYTQLLTKDKQQTFYLGTYNPDPEAAGDRFSTSIGTDDIFTIDILQPTVEYCDTNNEFALELTFLHENSGVVGRKIIDRCSILTDGTEDKLVFDVGDSDTVTITPPGDSHLLLIRVIALSDNFSGVKLQLNKADGNWPLQGKTIYSTAKTNTGVTKKIRFFQSYPQIPAELFVTSF